MKEMTAIKFSERERDNGINILSQNKTGFADLNHGNFNHWFSLQLKSDGFCQKNHVI